MFNSFENIRKKADSVRNIDLSRLLQRHGCTKDPLDKAKWQTPRGVISVNGQKFMNWTLGTGGGGAIDLVIHLQGVGFKDAVFWLCNNFSSTSAQQNSPKRSYSPKQILKLPQRDDGKLLQVIYYLTDQRRIPKKMTGSLIESGKLYADVRANAVFLLLGKKRKLLELSCVELLVFNGAVWHPAHRRIKDVSILSVHPQERWCFVNQPLMPCPVLCFTLNTLRYQLQVRLLIQRGYKLL